MPPGPKSISIRLPPGRVAHGLAVAWQGSSAHRLHLSQFTWQRRRTSAAPPVAPAKPSLWGRLFGRAVRSGRVASVPVDDSPATLPQHLEWHRAPRSTAGFDSGAASRFRARWASWSEAPGQVGHLGMPPVFTPTGGRLVLYARDARFNLRIAAQEFLRKRGRNARSSE